MMRHLTLLALFMICFSNLFAQSDVAGENSSGGVEKPSRDFLMFQLTYNGWANKPDSIKTGGIGRGAALYLCYDFPIKASNFSFAAGLGVSSANIYFNNQQVNIGDTLTGQTTFTAESRDYSKYKLTTAYLEAPFELRYFSDKRNRNRGFKAAIGARVGWLVGAHTKAKYTAGGYKFTEKVSNTRDFQTWNLTGTARVGWGNFFIIGTYGITQMFKQNQGPGVYPYSIGLCFTGL